MSISSRLSGQHFPFADRGGLSETRNRVKLETFTFLSATETAPA
jgi:hypothetical protein